MSIANDFGPAQTAAVDDAGMVQLIGEDQVFRPDESGNRGQIGCETALKSHTSLGILERCQRLFQLNMQACGPGNGTDRPRPHAVRLDALLRRLAYARMVGQPQIVVGAKVE